MAHRHTSSKGSTGSAGNLGLPGRLLLGISHYCHVSSNLYTQALEKLFQYVIKGNFEFLKLNFLVHSAGNTRVKSKADVLLTEPFFVPATLVLYQSAHCLHQLFALGYLLQNLYKRHPSIQHTELRAYFL